MRYSRPSPDNCFFNGWALNICRSSQRSPALGLATRRKASSDGVLLEPLSKSETAFGLTARSSEVAPASFCTFTRKLRQPFSTSSAVAGPCATLTRISGLICRAKRQWRSRISWILATDVFASASSSNDLREIRSSGLKGDPRYSVASTRRVTWADSGCQSMLLTTGKSAATSTPLTKKVEKEMIGLIPE